MSSVLYYRTSTALYGRYPRISVGAHTVVPFAAADHFPIQGSELAVLLQATARSSFPQPGLRATSFVRCYKVRAAVF